MTVPEQKAKRNESRETHGGGGCPAGHQWSPAASAIRAFIRDLADVVSARVANNTASFFADRQFLVWLLAWVIGLAGGLATVAFRGLIGFFQLPWLGSDSELVLSLSRVVPWWAILFAPAIGGLIVGLLLTFFVPGRRAQAVADVIEARAIGDCKIRLSAGLWSALVAALSLGSGASAGREGPVVHLGATLASFVENRFKLSPGSRRTLLASGVAAAVSASFNAPVAAVLFAHEVILAHFAPRALVPLVISSVTSTVITRLHYGDFPAFVIPRHQITSYLEFPAFALLGLVCAVVVILFEAALVLTDRVAFRIEMPLWVRPMLGGLMVGAIALVFPHVLGVGYEATDAALSGQLPLWLLLSLILAKTAATAITIASRFGGGIFSPSIYLGAMTGGAFGVMAASAFPDVGASEGLYAILGMGAVASAVLGAPFSTTLIVFELTRGWDITIALLLTIAICNGLTSAVLGGSFFHWQLARRGLVLDAGPHQEIMRRFYVRDFMQLSDPGSPLPAPLAADSPRLLPGETLGHALRMFDAHGLTRIPVVSPEDPSRIIGFARRVAALGTYNKALVESHEEGHR
ncbi:MAG: chloride channel protein [Hyphomicrobiaceae bacterium]